MAVGVAFANLTVLAVDETLGVLVPGNLPCDGSGLLLGAGASGCSGVTSALDLPATLGVGSDMLIASCHHATSLEKRKNSFPRFSCHWAVWKMRASWRPPARISVLVSLDAASQLPRKA